MTVTDICWVNFKNRLRKKLHTIAEIDNEEIPNCTDNFLWLGAVAHFKFP